MATGVWATSTTSAPRGSSKALNWLASKSGLKKCPRRFQPLPKQLEAALQVHELHTGLSEIIPIRLFKSRTGDNRVLLPGENLGNQIPDRCQPRPPVRVVQRNALAHLLVGWRMAMVAFMELASQISRQPLPDGRFTGTRHADENDDHRGWGTADVVALAGGNFFTARDRPEIFGEAFCHVFLSAGPGSIAENRKNKRPFSLIGKVLKTR